MVNEIHSPGKDQPSWSKQTDSHLLQKPIKIWREKNGEAEVVREVLLFLIFFTNFQVTADPGERENFRSKGGFVCVEEECLLYLLYKAKEKISTLIVF